MKKITIKSAKTRAWSATSRYVRARDQHCVTCGQLASEAGHYKHNSDKPNKQLGGNELWYDLRNINGQCYRCNRLLSGNLAPYALYLEGKYGAGILQELQALYNTPRKWTIEELLEIENEHLELLANLEKSWYNK